MLKTYDEILLLVRVLQGSWKSVRRKGDDSDVFPWVPVFG